MDKVELDNNIDRNIKDITDAILMAAEKSIPNKVVTIKPNEHSMDNVWY